VIENSKTNDDFVLSVGLKSNGTEIGFCGQFIKQWQSFVNAKHPIFFAEVDVDLALHGVESTKKFRELDRFPSITRDIAMIVPEEISHAKILGAIENPKEPLLESVELFDLFTTNVGEERKSLAYRLTYRDRSRTLTSEEVSAVHAKIRERLRHDLGAELRE
jgi:phenylalanyl-tRNA synthetase beta chain